MRLTMDILHAIRSRTMPVGGTFELMDEAAAEIERLRAAIKEALQCLALEDNLGFATRELERTLEQQAQPPLDDPIDWNEQNKKMIAAWQARGLLTPAEAENFLRKINGEEQSR